MVPPTRSPPKDLVNNCPLPPPHFLFGKNPHGRLWPVLCCWNPVLDMVIPVSEGQQGNDVAVYLLEWNTD